MQGEVRFDLRAVARGIAVGKAAVLFGRKHQFRKTKVRPAAVKGEIVRFRTALALAKKQLERLSASSPGAAAHARHGIFDAHLLMISDPTFEEKVVSKVSESLFNAEWAVRSVCDSISDIFRKSADEHLRERAADFEDIGERLMAALGSGAPLRIRKDSIVVAPEVTPSLMAEFGKMQLAGLVAERGGWTSHSFILARELGIPAVTGLKGGTRRIRTGDFVVVDGFLGQLIVNPTEETKRRYRALKRKGAADHRPRVNPKGTVRTLDGVEISVLANVESPDGYEPARRLGARGIGLYRSEFLFNEKDGFPSEALQTKTYQKIGEVAGRHGAKIRTFDLSVARVMDAGVDHERNPALGLRATRLMFEYPDEFRRQLRSLLKASKGNRIEILVPMVSDVGEIHIVRRMLEEERKKLSSRGFKVQTPVLGAMIEVPSAVLIAPEIAAASDFISLGTNDLVQYLMAVDRDNESVADYYRTLHPAVLRAIKSVITAATSVGKKVIVCGEMASSPVYAAILIGLGARELSMNASSVERIRYLVSSVAEEECAAIASQLLKCSTADQVEAEVRESFSVTWSNIFPHGTFTDGSAR